MTRRAQDRADRAWTEHGEDGEHGGCSTRGAQDDELDLAGWGSGL
jgi:hypothetical protein